jgi:hypothetical protein
MKIISGGQTGADRAALIAAFDSNIETGGWMPKGFKAQDGTWPEFAEAFNIKEHESPYYPPRTALNVKESDATIRFASDWSSSGELLTLNMINQYKKPYLDIDIITPLNHTVTVEFIKRYQIINIAGNSERTSPGIYDFVYNYLIETFRLC